MTEETFSNINQIVKTNEEKKFNQSWSARLCWRAQINQNFLKYFNFFYYG